MHRQTIDCYDAGAERWRVTRRAEPATSTVVAPARAFRAAVGDGLILDLGCGPGAALDALGSPVIGVDASLGMLRLSQRTSRQPLVGGDVEDIPLRSNVAAGAFASFSFQHLPRPQFMQALSEVARVLRPHGRLEIWMHGSEGTDGVRADDDMGLGRWFTYWSRQELEVALPSAGLEVTSIEDHQYARRTVARAPR